MESPGKEEQKHRFVILRAKGYSYARIGRELGVSKGTLTAWNGELEAQIAATRAMELEALQEEFFLLKAIEQTELAAKLDRLAAVVQSRR